MGMLLMIVGLGWASFGVFNCGIVFINTSSPEVNGTFIQITIVMHMLMYWLPGLALGGIGRILLYFEPAVSESQSIVLSDEIPSECPKCHGLNIGPATGWCTDCNAHTAGRK